MLHNGMLLDALPYQETRIVQYGYSRSMNPPDEQTGTCTSPGSLRRHFPKRDLENGLPPQEKRRE